MPQVTLTLVTLILACWVVMGELDRLVGMALADGYSASLSATQRPRLLVPFPHGESRPWLTLHQVGPAADQHVAAYLIVDTLMALLIGLLLWRFLARVRPVLDLIEEENDEATRKSLWIFAPRSYWVALAVGADVLENVLLWVLSSGPATREVGLPLVLACALATAAKWLLLLRAVLPIIYALTTQPGRGWVTRRAKAFVALRYSVLAFAPIALLALVPRAGMLDQLPDVQRSWFENVTREGSAPGLQHLTASIIVLAGISFGILVLGRLVADLARRRARGEGFHRPSAALWIWAVLPGTALSLALLLWAMGHGDAVRPAPLLVFCLVPAIVIVVSWWLRRTSNSRSGFAKPPPRNYDPHEASQVQRMGDVLALAGPVVASLALLRAHTALLALQQGNAIQQLLPVLCTAIAVAVWWIGPVLIRRMEATSNVGSVLRVDDDLSGLSCVTDQASVNRHGVPQNSQTRKLWWASWVMVGLSTSVIAFMCLFPVWVAHHMGALGAVLLALGALSLFVGAHVVLHAIYDPAEIFWLRGLQRRETPIATLLALTILAVLLSGSNQDVHGVRGRSTAAATTATAPSPTGRELTDGIDRWATRVSSNRCTVTVPDTREAPAGDESAPVEALPLVLVAAEGGGIRAAYWAAAALETVGEGMPESCGLAPVALASGVSGGSVGLAVSRYTKGGQPAAVEAVWKMSGPDALAQATVGMLLRDPIYTAIGLPSIPGDAPGDQWLDRAGLMEAEWENQAPGLKEPFLTPPAVGTSDFAADLILNSTSVSSGCRVLVSTVTGTAVDGDVVSRDTTCADLAAPLPFSRDFVTDYMSGGTDAGGDTCMSSLTAGTASMLSARFPYITPSGVVGPCGEAPETQLIDGGYAEGSGLGALSDIVPATLEAAAEHGTEDRPVQPIIIYLDNGRGGDIAPPPPQPVSEVLVPPLGYMNGGDTQLSTAAQLQRLVGVRGDLVRVLPARVYVVAQPSKPAIEAPLGWVLSQASRDDMDSSLADASQEAKLRWCEKARPSPDWSAGVQKYQQLPDFLVLMRPKCGG